MPVDPVEQATSADADFAKPLGDVCAGCSELTERIERLESLLSERGNEVAVSNLGTTACYWICVGVHAFVTFSLFTNEVGIQFGLMMLAGATGTLAVCHVFSTRPIHLRLLRSLLSIAIVATSAMAAMAVSEDVEVWELVGAVCLYLPFLVGSAWLVAKLFVWTRGWRIVPPNGSNEFPKLRIWHLMFCTFIAAVLLAVGRAAVNDTTDWVASEMMGVVLYITVPAALSTVFACTLARIVLLPNNSRALFQGALLVSLALVLTGLAWTLVLVFAEGIDNASDLFLALVLYGPISVIGFLTSPFFTFWMLRVANYQFVLPRQGKHARSAHVAAAD